jgi:hypothetical protein
LVLAERLEAGSGAGQDADGAADHSGGSGVHPPARAALVIAGRAEVLLQVVVRPGEARDVIAVEPPGAVAGTDFEEVGDRRGEGAHGRLVRRHFLEQFVQLASDCGAGRRVDVRQDSRRAVDPGIGGADRRPQGVRRGEPVDPQPPQAGQFDRAPPFSVRLSRDAAMARRRSWSLRPDAQSGGRPSSVRALRTARQ